ncbi:hypothetical protein FA95DRAFT_1532257 [Auriscalpium vulgare]|uniref:Uncharacterized protein n=1 Tax=Auriscalpium vulgare TaxID=40419 RepID=A0ACB8S9R8_9AGAM|nr:hypothetical protein FA95DRAFT_1532257 [Auriscalpium vulgare]
MQYAGGQPYNQYNPQYGAYNSQPAYQYQQQPYYQQQQQPQAFQQSQPQYSGQLNTPQYGTSVPFPSPYTAPNQLQPTQSQPRPQRTHTPHPTRRHTSAGTNGQRPLRSALKNGEPRIQAVPVPVSRSRTHSGAAENRARVSSMTRTRTNSSSRMDPDHIFLSILPPNEVDISNIAFQSTVEELREKIFPMWPAGVVHQTHVGHNWHVKFAGNPWKSTGNDSILAQRMICMMFWVLAHQGYVYLTTINTGRASPRLVFIRAPADSLAHFFTMTLNHSGDKVTFINPPAIVTQTLGLSLRTTFPRQISNENVTDEGSYVIELKGGIGGMSRLGIDRDMFLAHILKHINDYAFKLDASIPMARRGLFGLGGRRELWVFKGSESWWNTQAAAGRK